MTGGKYKLPACPRLSQTVKAVYIDLFDEKEDGLTQFCIFRIWSKIIILHAPALGDTSPDKQDEVDEILTKIHRDSGKGVLYNLSFAKLFDDWDVKRKDFLR